jgi:1-deoxy-D-xylulose 5-phosphate reductoisomerase
MRTRGRMLATATLIALTVLPAGVAPASQAEERGQRVLERTLAREHHAVPVPADPATQAAELRTQAREQGAYPAPTGQQTANTHLAEASRPTTLFAVVGVVGLTVLLAAAAALLWLRGRARPREAT